MDQTREIIKANSDSIKKQCQILRNLLNKIEQVVDGHSSAVQQLQSKELAKNLTYVQSVNMFHYSLLSELSGTNLKVENLYENAPVLFHSEIDDVMNHLSEIIQISSCANSTFSEKISSGRDSRARLTSETANIETAEGISTVEARDVLTPSSEEYQSCSREEKDECVMSSDCKLDVKNAEIKTEEPKGKPTVLDKIKASETWTKHKENKAVIQLAGCAFKPSGKYNTNSLTNSDVISVEQNSQNGRNKVKVGSEIFPRKLKNKVPPVVGAKCLISHIETPSEFYIQLFDEEIVQPEKISEIIAQYYSDKPFDFSSKDCAQNELGQYCVAFIERYKSWYRVEILDWFMNCKEKADEVRVQLVDYGQSYTISYQLLRPLIWDIISIPKLAFRCYFPYLYPPGDQYSHEWPVESIQCFFEMVGEDLEKIFTITYIVAKRNALGVELINEDNQSIAQILIDNGLAEVHTLQNGDIITNSNMCNQILDAQKIDYVPNMTQEEIMNRYFGTIGNLETADNINEAVANYDPKDEARICKFTTVNGQKCFKKNCQLEHTLITKDFTTDKIPVFMNAMNALTMPKSNDEIRILITYAMDVCHFYCHIKSFASGLKRLTKKMNDRNIIKSYKQLKLLPSPGEVLVGKGFDGQWQRVCVKDVYGEPQNEIVQGFIVDYGETIDIKLSDMRQITEDFLQLPFQAVECRLSNAEVDSDADDVVARQFFEERYVCKEFQAKVVRANVGYLVVQVTDEHGFDIGETLIENGFASPTTVDVYPSKMEMMLVD